jgi:tight adherence protein B
MIRRLGSVLILGLMALALAGGGTAAASDQPVSIRRVDVEAYPNIDLTISVDGPIAPVDVRVAENGAAVDVLTIRPLIDAGGEMDVFLAIDTSDSVRGGPLVAAVAAAKSFVSRLPAGVPVGVLTFSDRPQVLLPIEADRSRVLSVLDSITDTAAGTAVYDGVGEAAAQLQGTGQHNIVVVTDGRDVGSDRTLDEAIAAAQRAKAAVYTIGIVGTRSDFAPLQELAGRTGGTFGTATSDDLSRLYTDLAGRLSHQYRVLYRSTAPGGAHVTISVDVPGGSDSSIVLMPRLVGAAPKDKSSHPLLAGNLGLGITLALSFIAIFILLIVPLEGVVRGRRAKMLAARMGTEPVPATPEARAEGRAPSSWIPQPIVHAAEQVAEVGGFRAGLDRKLEMAGMALRSGELVSISAMASLFGAIVSGLLLRNVVLAAILGIVIASVPFLVVHRGVERRTNALDEQLPDVLMVLASSMRAGHSFLQALDTVSKEIGEPSGPEFARVVAEIRLGRPFDEAITAMAERVGSEEFQWAMLAVNIQREVGGNLAEILDTLAETVRERQAIRRQIKVLSSEGRLSIRILVALPFLITLYVIKVNGDYMKLLWTTWLGLVLIGVGAFLMLAGLIWARKLVKINV